MVPDILCCTPALFSIEYVTNTSLEQLVELAEHFLLVDPLARLFGDVFHVIRSKQCHQNGLLVHYFVLLPNRVSIPVSALLRSNCRVIGVKRFLKGVKQEEQVFKFGSKLLCGLLHDELRGDSRFGPNFQCFM